MPKDEFDFEDPLELNGVALLSTEDTTQAMTECFIEEFMRLGYNHKQILALFRNPHYLGPNMALQNCGEPFIRASITEVFARWGKPVRWANQSEAVQQQNEPAGPPPLQPAAETEPAAVDPMGTPVPKLNL